MSLKRTVIYTLIHQLNELLPGAHLESIKEIVPLKWIFTFKRESILFRLLLCLKTPFPRFHLLSSSCKNYETPSTQSWWAILNHAIVESVTMLGSDRILKISFNKNSIKYSIVFEVFPQKPNLYLLDFDQKILFVFNAIAATRYTPPKNLKEFELLELDPLITHKSIEKFYEEQECESEFLLIKNRIESELKQRIKKNIKLEKKSLADRDYCLTWKDIQHEGMLLQANLYRMTKGLNELVATDWEKNDRPFKIDLDGKLTPIQEVENRFKLSKKLKNGLTFHQKNLKKLHEDFLTLNSFQKELEACSTLESLQKFASKIGFALNPSPKEKISKSLPFHEFTSASGTFIWVGKNAKANDKLTFSYAKGSDWWLHISQFPGSHVVIRIQKKTVPDDETLKDALQLAIAYSKAKDKGEGEICITQCKYVSRLGKNQPGKVQISQHKLVYVKFNPDRFQQIKKRHSIKS